MDGPRLIMRMSGAVAAASAALIDPAAGVGLAGKTPRVVLMCHNTNRSALVAGPTIHI